MKVYSSLSELVGNTPLLRLYGFEKEQNLTSAVLAKLEYFNPAGSAKDRVAKSILEQAEKDGSLKSGGVIIEPTSGNTGIALAALARAKGYRVVITMPENMSAERRLLFQAYGAELVLTSAKAGMQGAIEKAKELQAQIPDSIIAGQFENPANPLAHYQTTGVEIWEDTDGKIDVLVCTVGTGGTLSGTAKYLKEKNPNVRVIAVEPSGSPLLSQGKCGAHKIQGIGANFIPKTLDCSAFDEVITVSDEDAYAFAQKAAKTDGAFVGISSGAALCAAAKIAEKEQGKMIVAICPDGGSRYLSTPDFIR